MPDETPEKTAPVDLEVLAERVRERLHAHGQHGALAEFAKYTAAVNERLERAIITPQLEQVGAYAAETVPTSAQGKAKAPKAPATKKPKAAK